MIQCFWVEPTGEGRRYLRRYAAGACRNDGARCDYGHEAEFEIERCPVVRDTYWFPAPGFDDPEHRDSRWPTECTSCGRPFEPSDGFQVMVVALYRRIDGIAGEYALSGFDDDASIVGAMYDGWWHFPRQPHAPNDGISLVVQTPGGAWFVDGPASNGPGWTRTGDPRANPPTVTATPSIQCFSYHGCLRGGKLVLA
jgi:hypothetical protein